jgi:hypothetical protein
MVTGRRVVRRYTLTTPSPRKARIVGALRLLERTLGRWDERRARDAEQLTRWAFGDVRCQRSLRKDG